MRFPKTIRHRKAEARIYGRTKAYPFYRVAGYVAGKRRMASYPTYSEAKEAAEKLVREIAAGSQAAALNGAQARDALAALECLDAFRQATGKRVSLRACVSEYVEASGKLDGYTLAEAVRGFLGGVASLHRKDVAEAVEEFIKADQPRTKASEGQRAQLSEKYTYTRDIRLRRFAATFPGHAVCDLTKAHLDAFMGSLGKFAPKSRNHHRAAVQQFLRWGVRKDYLPPTHRLGEADSLRPEHADVAEIGFHTPKEFLALLEAAEGPMRAMVAIGGLAGLRTAELLRLDWRDVWGVSGHIEVKAAKSKTRQRRLVEVCPALAAWLEPFRALTAGKVWDRTEDSFQKYAQDLRQAAGVKSKENGLRHSFCTYHLALGGNENATALQAGHAPALLHQHYKGLATRKEAEAWFAVKPGASPANVIPIAAAHGPVGQ